MCDCCENLKDQVAAVLDRVKYLEELSNYTGRKIEDSYCNGYFGRVYDLSGAKIVEDKGLEIIVQTDSMFYSANFHSYEEKTECLKRWMTSDSFYARGEN